MADVIYRICRKLNSMRLMPFGVWSFIYDRLHRKVKDPWR